MKPVKAWAVVDMNGQPSLRDYRIPVTWLRSPAQNLRKRIGATAIARVLITELPPKARTGRGR